MSLTARRIRVTGLVQGVGFRPFVWRLANAHGLQGWVRNDAAGVDVHVEGDAECIDRFIAGLKAEAPPLARVDAVNATETGPEGIMAFTIDTSRAGDVHTMIGADTAVCDECLTEMFDPANRRWRHAFITCTHCGPRYTLTHRLPYDRTYTSMAAFQQCPACLKEYTDPAHRRFHSETNCCPACGPQLSLLDAQGVPKQGDPITGALRLLSEGAIVAIKGLGGFHLACDARNPDAVARLRLRKDRDEKPFALMAVNAESVSTWVEVDAVGRAALDARERPIVLLPAKVAIDEAFPGLAPGLDAVGVMRPYTPLQWLLFHEAAERPAGTAWMEAPNPLLLVMTSANPGGEPLTIANEEAQARLAGIADAWLLHDRDILTRCDDSVVKPTATGVQSIRRARGFTPSPIALSEDGPCVLALGAWLKNTVCVTRDAQAWVSQHIGDLDNGASCGFLEETVAHLLKLLDVKPVRIAHDLHPDFHSTQFALALAQQLEVPTLAVQHHHAHVAAVAAEHGHRGPLLGLAMDGVGLGTDGEAWGGELLLLEGAGFERVGHLAPLLMPGGDRAAREPWRMAASALWQMGQGAQIAARFCEVPLAEQMAGVLERRIRCPQTTSLGRVFDAAAGLLGVRAIASYEGQAAMQLEALAARYGKAPAWDDVSEQADGAILDLLPLLQRLATWSGDVAEAAARFHATLADLLAAWAARYARDRDVDTVALAGGCFLNGILSRRVNEQLIVEGLRVLTPRQMPPNDGAISLGQAWVGWQVDGLVMRD